MTLESQTYASSGAPADDAPAGPDQKQAHPAGHRTKRRGPLHLLRKVWLPIVIVLVIAIAAFGVFRLHGVFGKTETTRPGSGLANDTKPFNPKTVVYEIYGPPGAVATINYLDLDAQPQIVRDVTLPWSLTLTTTAPAASANIVAQGDSDTIGCRITVNGELKDEKTNTGVNAQTFCLVKSA
ncbi:hypothetical protein D3H54_17020 [Mycobacterium sp. ELW1]|nr:hypothetical protein D3H54_17020 [Mycobacterium sp. ELW1]